MDALNCWCRSLLLVVFKLFVLTLFSYRAVHRRCLCVFWLELFLCFCIVFAVCLSCCSHELVSMAKCAFMR